MVLNLIFNLVVITMLTDPATCDKGNVFSNGSYNVEAVDTDMNGYVSFEELVSNGSYNFEAADVNNNKYVSLEELVRYVVKQQGLDQNTFIEPKYVSLEELVRYVVKQQSLDHNTFIEPILRHAKIFYQHDFNDDGKLSIFEWKRGEELISVIRRVLLGNLKTNLLKDIYFLLVIYS